MDTPATRVESLSRSDRNELRSTILFALVALSLALLVRTYIAAPYIVSGDSMIPTFHNWDYLILDKYTYRSHEPQRGDIVVMKFPFDTSRNFIKRIIGLPGDTVRVTGKDVIISNSSLAVPVTLSEPYIDPLNQSDSDNSFVLGPDQFVALGDNRASSADSRTWGILPREDVVGRVLVRLFPFTAISTFPGQARYADFSSQ
jgi:signal peptidase I